MPVSTSLKFMFFQQIRNIFFLSLVLSSCYIPKKYQKDKPFVIKNRIEVKGGNFTKDELIALKSRLNAQLDDSSKINVIDKLFFLHYYNKPAVFDTASAAKSARNMKSSMLHLGYYRANAIFTADTIKVNKQQRVQVKYFIEPGKSTVIDTISYDLKKIDLQQLTMANLDKGLLKEGKSVTKAAILGEMSRLVELYRNNGYYKFTSEELKVRGDTSLEALTNISDDPFEQIRLLAEAQQKMKTPKIKLAIVLNPLADSNRLKKYYINNVYILPDYFPGDKLNDSTYTERVTSDLHIIRYHNKLFRSIFLSRNMVFKKGDLYKQSDYYKTLNSFSRAGVWQSTNIEIVEIKDKDSINKIDLIVQLIPAKQFSREFGIEASYSATSNTNTVTAANAGTLFGISGNAALTNRNLGKEGIKMTTTARAGIELNLRSNKSNATNIINSNELSLSNSIVFPRFVFPFNKWNKKQQFLSPETFINTNVSYIKRIDLFSLQSTNLGIGYSFRNKKNALWVFKPLNIEFTRLYNETDSFKKTLIENPFLRYSFNTALVAGNLNGSYSFTHSNPRHRSRENSFKVNIEESGILLGQLGIFKNYLRKFIKVDATYTNSRSRPKSALIFRAFAGLGIASKQDTTLPFFKQYFGGGSNSMRGWPVRGIGLGSKPLAPYSTNRFNDRTGDMQLETNLEYRFDIVQVVPNTLLLKGVLFVDAGNVWNLRNSKPNGELDSAQIKLKNIWKEMGINAGTGLRLDFSYFVVRFDFGFRFKRPELSNTNNGWKIPALSFNDAFNKIFARGANDEYRKWRYENFNFTIGINYPF